MAKTCKQCGTSLGFIARLKGVKPSEKDPEVCNKCESKTGASEDQGQPADQPQSE